MICIFLVAFVLFIYLLLSGTNFLINLLKVFLGYNISHKGFVCYVLSCDKFRISGNVVFFENQYFFSTHVESSSVAPILPHFEDVSPFERFKPEIVYERRQPTLPLPTIDPPANASPKSLILRLSTRVSYPPDWYGFSATLSNIPIPSCYSQVVQYECWQTVMQEEFRALQDNHTWDLLPYPPTVKPIRCKCVYSIKLHSDGTLDRYKACLAALGNRQEYDVDYEETFALVTKMIIILTIMVISASRGWSLHQMDIKNAFYMEI